MSILNWIIVFFVSLQSDWVEKPNGNWEKDFSCQIDIAEKSSPNSFDALPSGQPFSMFVTATKEEVISAKLTFTSPEHEKPLILESDKCLSDPLTTDEAGELTFGGETFQCPIFTNGNRFATIYAPQDEGWFSLVVVNGGASLVDEFDADAPMPDIYFDQYRGKCD